MYQQNIIFHSKEADNIYDENIQKSCNYECNDINDKPKNEASKSNLPIR